MKNIIIGRNSEAILSVLFPRRCPVCHEIVWPKGQLVCSGCRDKPSYIQEPTCRICGKSVSTWEEETCYDCARRQRSFAGGVSLMDYDDIGRSSMIAFKYKGRQEYAAFYADELWRRYSLKIRRFRADAIIPVPVHISRRRYRGYNQAERIGEELSARCGIPMIPDLLVRSRRTEAMKKLHAGERQRNLEEALEIRGDAGRFPRVILVDDIYTTGSTLEACTRVLKRAGVSEVFVVTVCIGRNS